MYDTAVIARLAPFTTFIVAILFADLGLAFMSNLKQIRRSKLNQMLRSATCYVLSLSVYLSDRDVSTIMPTRILPTTQPSLLFTTLLLTLVTFVLLFVLPNVAAATSRPDQNRGSVTEDYLASKELSTGSDPSRPPLFLLSVPFTTFRIAPRIVAATLMGRLLEGDALGPYSVETHQFCFRLYTSN